MKGNLLLCLSYLFLADCMHAPIEQSASHQANNNRSNGVSNNDDQININALDSRWRETQFRASDVSRAQRGISQNQTLSKEILQGFTLQDTSLALSRQRLDKQIGREVDSEHQVSKSPFNPESQLPVAPILFMDRYLHGPIPVAAAKENLRHYIENQAPKDIPRLKPLLQKIDNGILEDFVRALETLDPDFRAFPNLGFLAIPVGTQFLVRVPEEYTPPSLEHFAIVARGNKQLNKTAKNSFSSLAEAFHKDFPDNRLYLYQGYRSYEEQNALYLKKIKEVGSALGVASPGSSKHQLGIAVDLYFADNESTIIWRWPSEVLSWLETHGPSFGIVHPMASFDPPHYEALGAVHPNFIEAMNLCGLNIHDHYEINLALLATYNSLFDELVTRKP